MPKHTIIMVAIANGILHIHTGPPQNVVVVKSANNWNIMWEKPPLSNITNDPVMGYNIECSLLSTMNNSIKYKVNVAVQNTTTSVTIPLEDLLFNHNMSDVECCVEVEFETYSSIACHSAR